MTSSTPLTILTADEITHIVNEHINAGHAAAVSAVPFQDPPHSFKLKTFSGASKDWIDYDRSLTYDTEMPPFAPGTDELKTAASNTVQSRQLPTAIDTAISGDALAHFDSRDDLVGQGF